MEKSVCKKSIAFLQWNYVPLVFLVVLILSLEFISFNKYYLENKVGNLKERTFEVEDGSLFGFKFVDGELISENRDPNITFSGVDQPVKSLEIDCSNSNPDSSGQIFYSENGGRFSEEKSFRFSLESAEPIVVFPETIDVDSLRLDLTGTKGDALECQGFTLNPRIPYQFSWFRTGIYLLLIFAFVLCEKYIHPTTKEKLTKGLYKSSFWIFGTLLAIIDLAYGVMITYDSAHFLWLANLIKLGQWDSWDLIRNIGYPLQIFLSQAIFGYNQNGILIPMIIFHILLFVLSCKFVYEVIRTEDAKIRFLIALFIFFIIALNPTILGFYHVVLTEYVVATMAMFSCLVAIKLYQAPLFSKRFYLLFAFFLAMVPIAWHLKQPYVGAAYFPFFVVCGLIIFRKFTKKTIIFGALANIVLLALVLGSSTAWNYFLVSKGNPMKEERQFSSWLNRELNSQKTEIQDNKTSFVNELVIEYLVSSNYFYLDKTNLVIVKEPSVTRASQNGLIAQRIFNPGLANILGTAPYTDYALYLETNFNPPIWLNRLFQFNIEISNFLFTISYLILPLLVVLLLIRWFKTKGLMAAALLTATASSLLNVLIHLFAGANAIDRYLFLGYPLNLIVITILIIEAFLFILKGPLQKINNCHGEIEP